jgi:hypothetical protein
VAVGILWGVLTGLLLYVVDTEEHASQRRVRLLAEGESWFNPIGWAYRLRDTPAPRWGVAAGAAVLWLGVGWVLRVGARPRTPAAALGAAAAAGLLAAWVCNLFVAPLFAAGSQAQLYRLYAEEPPTWRFDPDGRNFRITQPDIDTEHLDLRTLERYVPPEKRDPTRMENAPAYSKAHEDLMDANRQYRASVGVWVSQFAALVLFLTAALSGGLSVDHLCRSGRGPLARVLCYAEVYGTTLLVLPAAALLATMLRVASEGAKHINPPPVGPFAGLFAGAVVMAGIAWVGVVRRWHPQVRIGLYLGIVGVLVAWFVQAWPRGG